MGVHVKERRGEREYTVGYKVYYQQESGMTVLFLSAEATSELFKFFQM